MCLFHVRRQMRAYWKTPVPPAESPCRFQFVSQHPLPSPPPAHTPPYKPSSISLKHLFIVDILPPEIICVNKTVTERGLYQYEVTVISDYGIEVNGDGSYFTVWDPLPPVVVPVGAMRMSVTAYDFSGNSAECIFYIILPGTCFYKVRWLHKTMITFLMKLMRYIHMSFNIHF